MDACSCYQDYNTRYQTTHSADSLILQTVQTPESDNKPPLLLELGRISKMSQKKPSILFSIKNGLNMARFYWD